MPHEEKRKIIKVGETSYGIILPKPWLRYYKLTDRNKLKVISNSNIIIEPPDKQEESLNKKQSFNQIENKTNFEIKKGGEAT
jgi:bifunctional DNA-binding transcriptional regulator/antitoxin component of YhaV-PrlF toxin-antitoxin module